MRNLVFLENLWGGWENRLWAAAVNMRARDRLTLSRVLMTTTASSPVNFETLSRFSALSMSVSICRRLADPGP